MRGILKKIFLTVIGVMHIGLCVNKGYVLYFLTHLQYGTYINGVDLGGKTVKQAEHYFKQAGKEYKLLLEERRGEEETILGSDIELSYELDEQIKDIKKEQSPYWWIRGLWGKNEYNIKVDKIFDETLLEQTFNELECLKEENNIKPENAELQLVNDTYEIKEGNPGSLVKKKELLEAIKASLDEEVEVLSLEDEGIYELPEITIEDANLKQKRDVLNRYISSVITYDFNGKKEVINHTLIKDWLIVKEGAPVSLDEEKVASYIKTLANQYDTVGSSRRFSTSVGTTVTVSGGDYGWQIDRDEECKAVIDILNQGNQKVTRKPIYKQEAKLAGTNDIGDTYVEINLTRQYLWFYKDGKLVTQGSIVSGTGSNSHATPAGTYMLKYKQANATLRGPGYACPVRYWMPFNGGIGIHDATWRGSFGGSIYVYNGSHGCINTPLSLAGTIFNEIEQGVPIVCYKD